jgi:UDP-N-acetyl-D-glucosamine dehydrogenase
MNAMPKLSALDAIAADYEARAKTRGLTIGIIGLGYVGLPLAIAYRDKGFPVIGFDIDDKKVDALANGSSYIKHISGERIVSLGFGKGFEATTDFSRLDEPDALLICVPTPLNLHREPDLSYVVKTTEAVAKRLRKGQIVILESTTYPGTSEEVMLPILEKESGLKCGIDFALAYSPEREDPGNIHFDTTTIPKVVGADTEAERRMAVALYEPITKTVPVSNLRTAEAVKLTENIFRLVNIALVNELKLVYGNMDIDVWEVIDAAKTKPFGFMPFYPGPGLGGHCIPIDPFYLTWKARAFGDSTRFIELAGDVVNRMPRHTVEMLAEALSTKRHRALAGAKVLVVGLAYKKNVDDMRESPSLLLIDILRKRGAEVAYHDPYIAEVPFDRHHVEFAGMKSVALTPEALKSFDCALIATDHDSIDYAALCENLPLVVDARNATKQVYHRFANKIVKV